MLNFFKALSMDVLGRSIFNLLLKAIQFSTEMRYNYPKSIERILKFWLQPTSLMLVRDLSVELQLNNHSLLCNKAYPSDGLSSFNSAEHLTPSVNPCVRESSPQFQWWQVQITACFAEGQKQNTLVTMSTVHTILGHNSRTKACDVVGCYYLMSSWRRGLFDECFLSEKSRQQKDWVYCTTLSATSLWCHLLTCYRALEKGWTQKGRKAEKQGKEKMENRKMIWASSTCQIT